MKRTTEADLLKQVKLYLELKNVLVIRINSGAFAGVHQGRKRFVKLNSEPGCSDLLCCWPPKGKLLAIETKMPGKQPTAAQASFLCAVRQRGGVAAVIHDLDELQALLDSLD